jgi:hypothetical protein
MGPLNFYLDKSMPTKTQHNTMSALVNNQRRMAMRSKLKPRGEEEMSSARRSSVHHHKLKMSIHRTNRQPQAELPTEVFGGEF